MDGTAPRGTATTPDGKARHLQSVIDTGWWIVLGKQEVDGKSKRAPELHT